MQQLGISPNRNVTDKGGNDKLFIVGKDDPLVEMERTITHVVRKKSMKMRFIDTYSLTDGRGVTIKVPSQEGEVTSGCGDIILIGKLGNLYLYKRDSFLKDHILLPYDMPCDCDVNITDFNLKVDNTEVPFKTHIIKKFLPCEVSQYREPSFAIPIPFPFRIQSYWGTVEGRAGDYIIYKNKDDYFRCPAKSLKLLYDIQYMH